VGNLHIPQYSLPWEQPLRAGTSVSSGASAVAVIPQPPVDYPANLSSPLSILVEASNGASDYGKDILHVHLTTLHLIVLQPPAMAQGTSSESRS
jgi:hypothetical protein